MNSQDTPPPNPGSPEAISYGCRCPVANNGHGKGGWMTGDTQYSKDTFWISFWISADCPLHGWIKDMPIPTKNSIQDQS